MSDKEIPVYKVGAVILRALDSASPQVFIIRPKPKNAGERPQLVLPRGSRQYHKASEWIDVRDAATAKAQAQHLEPLQRALTREVFEEAGLSEALLHEQEIYEMGARDYASRTKGNYPVYWFVITADQEAQDDMARAHPIDTTESEWVTLQQLEALAAKGEFAVGYVPVVKEALVLVGA